MDSNTTNERNVKPNPQEIDLLKLVRKIWNSRNLILKVCGIGTLIGLIINFGTPKEYTASTLIAPEGYRRSSSSGIGALASMADIDISSSSTTERDAIYPSLYPSIANSIPFLIRLFNIKVCEQKDSIVIPLSQYLKERQKVPWWNSITSVPVKLIGRTISLFKDTSDENREETKTKIDPFWLTREEAGMARAIASRINIEVDKKKKTNAGTRILPMTEEVYEAFQRVLANRKAPKVEQIIDGYSGFLFLDRRGKAMVSYQWEKRFQRAVEKHNKENKRKLPKITPHICRHTYCTNMAKSGISPKTLQYLMGHSSIEVTMNVYTNLGLVDAKREVDRLEAMKEINEKEQAGKRFRMA